MTQDPSKTTSNRGQLILHVGGHKTGSTSIQRAFANGGVQVKGIKIHYPLRTDFNAYRERFKRAADPKSPARQRQARRELERLAQKIEATEADYHVLSGEAFEYVDPALIRQTFDEYLPERAADMKVVYYARPHVQRIVATYVEHVKNGREMGIKRSVEELHEYFFAKEGFTFSPRFLAFREQFGDNFIARPMIHDQLVNGSVVDDFVHTFTGSKEITISYTQRANTSPGLKDLMRIKLLQKTLGQDLDARLRLRLGWEYAEMLSMAGVPDDGLRLHKSFLEELQFIYRDDAQVLDREFFGGQSLFEDALIGAMDTALDAPQSMEPADYLNADECVSIQALGRVLRTVAMGQESSKVTQFLSDRQNGLVARSLAGAPAQPANTPESTVAVQPEPAADTQIPAATPKPKKTTKSTTSRRSAKPEAAPKKAATTAKTTSARAAKAAATKTATSKAGTKAAGKSTTTASRRRSTKKQAS